MRGALLPLPSRFELFLLPVNVASSPSVYYVSLWELRCLYIMLQARINLAKPASIKFLNLPPKVGGGVKVKGGLR